MTQEEKNLLLIDLSARLSYGVKINVNGEEDTLLELGVDTGWVNASYDIDNVKPYLRPMSSMTEEEFFEYFHKYSKVIPKYEWKRIDVGIYRDVGIIPIDEYLDWLNAHHFDYRGLIEKGLALEAPEGMYNN